MGRKAENLVPQSTESLIEGCACGASMTTLEAKVKIDLYLKQLRLLLPTRLPAHPVKLIH